MKALLVSLGAIVPVIGILNFAGGIVGAIWAMIAGDWWALGYVLIGIVASHFLISILLVPAFGLGILGMRAAEKGRFTAARIVFALSSLWRVGLMGLWALFVTGVFLTHPRESSVYPMLLLAYGATTAPWAYLASKDLQSGNDYSAMSVLLFQAGYVIGAVLLLVNPDNTLYFSGPLIIALILLWIGEQMLAKGAIAADVATGRLAG